MREVLKANMKLLKDIIALNRARNAARMLDVNKALNAENDRDGFVDLERANNPRSVNDLEDEFTNSITGERAEW